MWALCDDKSPCCNGGSLRNEADVHLPGVHTGPCPAGSHTDSRWNGRTVGGGFILLNMAAYSSFQFISTVEGDGGGGVASTFVHKKEKKRKEKQSKEKRGYG